MVSFHSTCPVLFDSDAGFLLSLKPFGLPVCGAVAMMRFGSSFRVKALNVYEVEGGHTMVAPLFCLPLELLVEFMRKKAPSRLLREAFYNEGVLLESQTSIVSIDDIYDSDGTRSPGSPSPPIYFVIVQHENPRSCYAVEPKGEELAVYAAYARRGRKAQPDIILPDEVYAALREQAYGVIYLEQCSFATEFNIANAGVEVAEGKLVIDKRVMCQSVVFLEDAIFSGAEFQQFADFSDAEFQRDVNFRGAEFQEFAYFHGVEFQQFADFSDAKFQQDVNFIGAKFQRTYFHGAEFQQLADFSYAEFQQFADFSDAEFQQFADFSDAEFQKEVHFIRAEFQKAVHFIRAEFQEFAYFSDAEFQQFADFSDAEFQQFADFSDAEFRTQVRFERTTFRWSADFRDVRYWPNTVGQWLRRQFLNEWPRRLMIERFLWRVTERGQEEPRWLPRKLLAWEKYPGGRQKYPHGRPIKPTNFRLESEAVREMSNPSFKRYVADMHFIQDFVNEHPCQAWLWQVSSDYGRSLSLWGLMSLLIAVFFGLLYSELTLHPIVEHTPWLRATIGEVLIWLDPELEIDGASVTNWFTGFYFSAITFTTLGFGDVTPKDGAGQFWIVFEVILGYVMLGGLISIFANKFARRS